MRVNLPAPLRGALWMAFASFCYVTAATLAHHLGSSYSVFELTFIRAVVAVTLLAPMLARAGRTAFHTSRIGLHVLCGLFTYVAVLCWFYAATRMPVAEFFALQFITPLFTIALAMVVLRQSVGAKNWLATFIGFAGVLIILRPGIIEVTLGALAALISSAGYASINTTIKVTSRTDSSTAIVFYVNLLMVPLSLPMAVYVWRMPDWTDWPLIVGVALFSTVAFVATARAVSAADARVVQPVNFLRLPIAAAFGFFFFNEVSDRWTWIGALVIFASTYYVLTRETRTSPAPGSPEHQP